MSGGKVTLAGLDRMQRELEAMSRRHVPRAARELVNSLAFAGREAWQREMQARLTLRNQFTQRRALVDQCRTLRMSAIESRLGHTEPYMALLEKGGRERAAKRFRPIPTEVAAGQPKGSLKAGRRRLVRPSALISRLGSLKLRGANARGRKANNARAVQGAIRSGRRLALLDLGRGKGIYRVTGGRKRARVIKLYDLTRRSVLVPRTPTLALALKRALRKAPRLAHTALTRQLAHLPGTL